MRVLRCMCLCLVALALTSLLVPPGVLAQTELILGHRVLVGTLNTCDDAGSTDAYACNLDPPVTGYVTNRLYFFKANTANTGTATFAPNSLSPKTIKRLVGGITTDLIDNDIRVGQRVLLLDDGTNFQMLSASGNACAATSSDTVSGCVELATTAETTTGTDTTRAITPAGLAGATNVRSFYLPAGSMDVSGTCTLGTAAALLTNGPKLPTITCTDNDADSIEFDFVMPDGWNAGTITVELAVFNVGTNSSTLAYEMDFAGQCVSSGDVPTPHSTTGEQAATFSLTTTDNVEYHATTSAITLQGSCAAGDHVYMRGQIDATATTMTPMADVKLLGVKIEYTRSYGND